MIKYPQHNHIFTYFAINLAYNYQNWKNALNTENVNIHIYPPSPQQSK